MTYGPGFAARLSCRSSEKEPLYLNSYDPIATQTGNHAEAVHKVDYGGGGDELL